MYIISMNKSEKNIIKRIRYKLYELQYFATPQGVLGFNKISPIVQYHFQLQLTSDGTQRAVFVRHMEGGRMLEEGQHHRLRGKVKHNYLSKAKGTPNSQGELKHLSTVDTSADDVDSTYILVTLTPPLATTKNFTGHFHPRDTMKLLSSITSLLLIASTSAFVTLAHTN